MACLCSLSALLGGAYSAATYYDMMGLPFPSPAVECTGLWQWVNLFRFDRMCASMCSCKVPRSRGVLSLLLEDNPVNQAALALRRRVSSQISSGGRSVTLDKPFILTGKLLDREPAARDVFGAVPCGHVRCT